MTTPTDYYCMPLVALSQFGSSEPIVALLADFTVLLTGIAYN
jgi:hypothetical protein